MAQIAGKLLFGAGSATAGRGDKTHEYEGRETTNRHAAHERKVQTAASVLSSRTCVKRARPPFPDSTMPTVADDETAAAVAVIMAGGAGTRFWPMSTEARPKQFLPLTGPRTLLQATFDRIVPMVPAERILVLTNAAFVPLVREQLPEVPAHNVIGEPMRRDTAAAAALAALVVQHRFGNVPIVTLTADHHIEPAHHFRRRTAEAIAGAVATGALYTYAVTPDHPATGYGYLELEAADRPGEFVVRRFCEKPDRKTAEAFLATGRYAWNSGMFVWTAAAVEAEFARQHPGHIAALAPAAAALDGPDGPTALRAAFEPLPRISVDYAIMEHARAVRAVPGDFAWSDVGGFNTAAGFLPADGAGNRTIGDAALLDATNCVVYGADDELVALVDVHDLIVVRAGDRTLVCSRAAAERVKALVDRLDPSQR